MKWLSFLKPSWQAWISRRFSSERGTFKHSDSLKFSIVGLILGGITLVTVLSVMNGFQKRFQDNLREISSFHGRVRQAEPSLKAPILPPELEAQILFPFTETPILIQSRWTEPMPALVKGIEPDLLETDPSFNELLTLREGSWTLGAGEILIGERLAYVLGVRIGDTLDLTSLRSKDFNLANPNITQVKVAGIWESDYYDLNRYTLFIALDDSLETLTQTRHILWGMKVRDPNRLVLWQRSHTLNEGELSTWRDQNSAFLEALDFEKRAMTTLLALLFVIVGLNTYYAIRQKIVRHQVDMAILKALGASPADCLGIFMREGILVGFVGGLLGVTMGLALSLSLNQILWTLEANINGLLLRAGDLIGASPPLVSFALSVEGASELPLVIYWGDISLIFSLIFFSSLFFSWLATQNLAKSKPSSIMRYDA